MTSTASAKKDSAGGLFARYVSQNILGMLGLSAYVLADTFFISLAQGADGITALNLILPLYSLIFAIGSMIGVGSATRFKIYRARGDQEADYYFSNAIIFAVIFGLIFSLAGLFVPGPHRKASGRHGGHCGHWYTVYKNFYAFRTLFHDELHLQCLRPERRKSVPCHDSHFFQQYLQYRHGLCSDVPTENGNARRGSWPLPSLPSSGIGICCIHFFSGKRTPSVSVCSYPSLRRLGRACQLGVAAFMGEISSGVTTMVFNFLILGLTGNTGIAAYGVVANVALVGHSGLQRYLPGVPAASQ